MDKLLASSVMLQKLRKAEDALVNQAAKLSSGVSQYVNLNYLDKIKGYQG